MSFIEGSSGREITRTPFLRTFWYMVRLAGSSVWAILMASIPA